jgi:hypothetical protein
VQANLLTLRACHQRKYSYRRQDGHPAHRPEKSAAAHGPYRRKRPGGQHRHLFHSLHLFLCL